MPQSSSGTGTEAPPLWEWAPRPFRVYLHENKVTWNCHSDHNLPEWLRSKPLVISREGKRRLAHGACLFQPLRPGLLHNPPDDNLFKAASAYVVGGVSQRWTSSVPVPLLIDSESLTAGRPVTFQCRWWAQPVLLEATLNLLTGLWLPIYLDKVGQGFPWKAVTVLIIDYSCSISQ